MKLFLSKYIKKYTGFLFVLLNVSLFGKEVTSLLLHKLYASSLILSHLLIKLHLSHDFPKSYKVITELFDNVYLINII